ncbi:MAG: hypothetical protein AAGB46_04570 [Verrucomicrobiota bacterium]
MIRKSLGVWIGLGVVALAVLIGAAWWGSREEFVLVPFEELYPESEEALEGRLALEHLVNWLDENDEQLKVIEELIDEVWTDEVKLEFFEVGSEIGKGMKGWKGSCSIWLSG